MANIEVLLPESFGFCGGVRAADNITRDVALQAREHGLKPYGFHDIVHNADVTAEHERNGVTFVKNIDEIADPYSPVIVSAHGASRRIFSELTDKGHEVFDATCHLVNRTHQAVHAARLAGEKVLYICQGKPGVAETLHDEVAGIVGHMDYSVNEHGKLAANPVDRSYFEIGDPLRTTHLSETGKYHFVWQTTLLATEAAAYRDTLQRRIMMLQPDAQFGRIPNNFVCTAVQKRQDSTEKLVKDAIQKEITQLAVVTDPNSKNGKVYFERARQLAGERLAVFAVANAAEAAEQLDLTKSVAVTASASTPDNTILSVTSLFGRYDIPETDRSFGLADSTRIAFKLINLMRRRAEAGVAA